MKIREDARIYNQPDRSISDEKRYEDQMAMRANYLLLGDTNVKPEIEILNYRTSPILVDCPLKWINRGELIAGSFMCRISSVYDVENKDVDIYFKCEADVEDFLKINNVFSMTKNEVSHLAIYGGVLYNLIFGIHYTDPEDLISHFDIRACSIALDPNTNTVYAVKGAIADIAGRHIVFNPVPHNTTIARLVKYAQKGFDIDPWQRVFFADLIRDKKYNYDLEKSTGYRAVHK